MNAVQKLARMCKIFFASLWRGLRAGLRGLFGNVQWHAPAWLAFLVRLASNVWQYTRANPRQAALRAGAMLAIGAAAGGGWHYYHRPDPTKPVEATFQIQPPGRTRIEDAGAKPDPLSIRFSQSVAPLQNAGKEVSAGITISPVAEGVWRWNGDQELLFEPKSDWPVGTQYTVSFARQGVIAPQRLLKDYTLKFSSAPFVAKLGAAEFYQDPIDPKLKQVVATVNFSHSVDPVDFEKHVTLRLASQSEGVWGIGAESVKFNVSYDKFKLNAYVRSEPLAIPKENTTLKVSLSENVRAARGGPGSTGVQQTDVTIPGLFNLNVSNIDLTLVSNQQAEPEQVMILQASATVHENDMQKNVSAWLLPVYHPETKLEDRKKPFAWSDTSKIGPEILKQSTPIKLAPIAAEREWTTQHSFKYQTDVGRYLYVKVNAGIKSFGGYIMAKSHDSIVAVPPFPEELKILHSGSILTLSGERKVALFTRDVKALHYEVGRVLPGQIHHLISQSSGAFGSPVFRDPASFGVANLTELFTKDVTLPELSPGKPNYEAFDLSEYLGSASGGRRGLFLLSVASRDPAQDTTAKPVDDPQAESPGDTEAEPESAPPMEGEGQQSQTIRESRLLLVTDLGVIVKKSLDGSQDVFVQSIHNGDAVAGASVEIIGRNGAAIASKTTDKAGRAQLPSLKDFKNEQQPVMYLVKKGGDLSFLPMNRTDRNLDMSRFDVGGVANTVHAEKLSAYLFSDRGIYRPGDAFHIGMIVRAHDWTQNLAGIPLEAVVTDARGLVVKRDTIKLSASGFEELSYTTQETSPTGNYTVSLNFVKDGNPGAMLGSINVKVQEFLPDRMKMALTLSTQSVEGWVTPDKLKAQVNLQNLFGTPAANRRVTGEMTLTPAYPAFPSYRDFSFYDPQRAKEGVKESLVDGTTNEKGETEFDLNLSRFTRATYQLHIVANGFEAEGGRSVASETAQLVSSMPYLIGFKPDGDFAYLSKDTQHGADLVAINPQAQKIAINNLTVTHFERKYLSVLTKQNNGTYKYESIHKEVEITKSALNIPATGGKLDLPTQQPGSFALVIRDADGIELNRIDYTVAGKGNLTRSLDRNAELQITLSKKDYAAGEDVELQIRAPYTGAGLITIERDKVYSHQWFKTKTTTSVQKIKVPAGLEGNGYVSVTFVRDVNSDEIFMSPLSHGVVPFSVSLNQRKTKMEITAPDLVKPGEALTMQLKIDKPGKVVVIAVDEGILQVAGYRTADPLGFFFQKRALDVKTAQILDLILPEFKKLMQLAAPGGDANGAIGKHLNPFKRKRDKPAVFWSGIVDVDANGKTFSYQVPDSFNGTMRIMAVAVSDQTIGVVERKTSVRGDFVLSPNVPTAVAPGDEFDVSVSVANNVIGSGKQAAVAVTLATSPQLAVVGIKKVDLKIDEMHEGAVVFRVKATDRLGSGTLTFGASLGSKSAQLGTSVSVRPAVPFMTELKAGFFQDGNKEVSLTRDLYNEYRTSQASISLLPLGMAHGLLGYLENYPYGCTEQITSQTFPAIVLRNRPEFGSTKITPEQALASTITVLRSRQNAEGGFGLWAANEHVDDFASVYAMHMLIDANERGMAVPKDLLDSGNQYLHKLAASESSDLGQERVRAYAVYLITRQGTVTSNYIAALQKRLDENHHKTWQQDLTGTYLAAAFQLMKQERAADNLIAETRIGERKQAQFSYYYDDGIHNAQALYLIARHFPERLKKLPGDTLNHLVRRIQDGSYNTLSSAYTILALDAYATAAGATNMAKLGIVVKNNKGELSELPLPDGLFPRVNMNPDTASVRFSSAGNLNAFYLVNQSGFDRKLPTKDIRNGLEVLREYTGADGKPISTVKLGDEIDVHVKFRAIERAGMNYVAIVDLLPGGFEVVDESRRPAAGNGAAQPSAGNVPTVGGNGSNWTPEYADVREDRVVLFGSVSATAQEFVYRIKATNVGTYAVPPTFGESMYERNVQARSLGGSIKVEKK